MDGQIGFAFVDLAGFTALTEAHGDDVGAAQVARFCEITRGALTGGTELVKSLGDAVMLAGPPGGVLITALAVMRTCLAEPEFPVPRAGAHAGPAVRQDGDYLGTAVNTAARIAARAAGGQLQLSASMLPHAQTAGETALPLGPVALRNLREPVDLHLIELDARGALIDPVCRMRVALERTAGHLKHAGADWWFCSLPCAAAFAADPDAYNPAY